MGSLPRNGPLTGAEYWAQQRSHMYQTPNNHLNPSTASFQPNGMEVQRYQPMPPTPPSTSPAPSADALQLRDMVLESHFNHTQDIASLERKTQANSDAIKDTQDIFGNDLRTLQDQFDSLKEQMKLQHQHAGMLTRQSLSGQDVTPSRYFLENFPKEHIAQAYLEKAEDFEAAAAKLRAEREGLCASAGLTMSTTSTLLKTLNNGNASENKTHFACCEQPYASADDLVDHVRIAHISNIRESAQQSIAIDCTVLADGTRGEDTPTHVPARKAKPVAAAEEADLIEMETPKKPNQSQAVKIESAALKVSAQPSSATQKGTESTAQWVPLAVRQMPRTQAVAIDRNITFTFDFLQNNLCGKEWSPGYYFSPGNTELPSKSYWILEPEFEPFLPDAPGLHGAKLTAFFNMTGCEPGEGPEVEHYMNVPVFIRVKGELSAEYVYYGNYSQHRFSDKLDYDHLMEHVSEKVRRHHAEELASVGRPQWITNELIDHFWPKPRYDGAIPTDSQLNTPKTDATPQTEMSVMLEKHVMQALIDYAEELKGWRKEAEMRVSHLTADNIMEAFEKADVDAVPGLRLWFEYMQFEKYDDKFYDIYLLGLKANPKLQTYGLGSLPQTPEKADIGGKWVKATNGVEMLTATPPPGSASTVKPVKLGKPPHTRKKEPSELSPDDSVSVRMEREDRRTAEVAQKSNGWDSNRTSSKSRAKEKTHTAGTKPWEKVEAAKGAQATASGEHAWDADDDRPAAKGWGAAPNASMIEAKKAQEDYKRGKKGQGRSGKRG